MNLSLKSHIESKDVEEEIVINCEVSIFFFGLSNPEDMKLSDKTGNPLKVYRILEHDI